MSGLHDDKFKQMQDEMSRFEEEIGMPDVGIGPRRIGTNTFNDAQKQLATVPEMGHSMALVPPPPPPSFVPTSVRPASSTRSQSISSSYGMMVPPMVPIQSSYSSSVSSRYIPPMESTVLSGSPMMYVKPKMPDVSVYHQEPPPVPEMLPNQETLEEAKRMQKIHKKAMELSYQLSRRKEKKNKKLIRTAGGQSWEDMTLAEWEDDDFRLFCGDLGNDVTDEVLTRAFSKYPSFLKAKVVRDKRTNKTKGFGFVSFKDPQDFIRATKEMNGRYVGSRPIKLRKSTWKNRSLDVVRKKDKEKTTLINLLTGK